MANRKDRRREQALRRNLPSAQSRLDSRDPFAAFTSLDAEHKRKLDELGVTLYRKLEGFSWLEAVAVCLKLAAAFAYIGERNELLSGGSPLDGFDENTFAENARRNYRMMAAEESARSAPGRPS